MIIKDKHFTFPIQEQDYPTVYLFYLFKINWTLLIFLCVFVNIVAYITDRIDGYSIYGICVHKQYMTLCSVSCFRCFLAIVALISLACNFQPYASNENYIFVSPWQIWIQDWVTVFVFILFWFPENITLFHSIKNIIKW